MMAHERHEELLMAEPTPLWRKAFDAAEQAVAPHLEQAVRTDQFAIAVGVVQRVQNELRQRGERTSRQVLHLLNLPAGSDVNRLMAQIGSLEREVRELRKQLADATDGRDAREAREAGRSNGAATA
jgi:hypothetical protein